MHEPKLEVHPEVDEDIIVISTYIALDNPAAAEAVEFAITDTFELLASRPQMGTEYHPIRRALHGIRMFTVIAYPNYLIYYRPLPDNTGVRILYALHAARDAATFVHEQPRQ